MTSDSEQTVWSRPEVFPGKPKAAPYGAVSPRGRQVEFQTLEELTHHIHHGRDGVEAVWMPEQEQLMPPEAVSEFVEPLRARLLEQAELDAYNARRNTLIFAILVLWALYANVANGTAPTESFEVGLAGILLTVLGLVPWYDACRERRSAKALNKQAMAMEEQEARFDYWLKHHRIWFTRVLIALLAVCGVIQPWVGLETAVEVAGLRAGGFGAAESYRLLTAPFLHGHPLHWALNVWGIWYLGRRVESLAGWPHLSSVMVFSMLAGGLATSHFMPEKASIGASGGVLGLLGFLLIFETLHGELVPRSSRRRLLGALGVTLLVGFIGYQFIDNFAHGGGLLAGMLYAGIAFPRSGSNRRPRASKRDTALGVTGLLILAASSIWAGLLLLGA